MEEKLPKHRDELAAAARRRHTWEEKKRAAQQSYRPFKPTCPATPAAKAIIERLKQQRSNQ